MEYQKIANLLDDASSNQPSIFKTKNWVEINDESRGTYNFNSQIKFENYYVKIYNHFHNIVRLFDVVPIFPFSTSETMVDYYL